MIDTVHAPVHPLVERLMAEGPIGMAAAARLLGTFRGGKSTHSSTLTRWVQAGVRLADGTPLRLEAIRVSGRLVTSRAAVARFLSAQQSQPEPTPLPRSPAARQQASEAAAAELDRLGV